MSLLDTIRGWLPGGTAPAARMERAKEAIPGASYRDPGEGFRPLTGQESRDLSTVSQERMIEIAYWLWETNGLARRIIQMKRDFLMAEGITWSAEDPKVDQIIDNFWNDPVNEFELKLSKKVSELFLYGEQLYPAFTSEHAGTVRLGYVDPASIKEVVTDPENCEIIVGIALKSRGSRKGKRYRVIVDADDDESIFSAAGMRLRETFDDGECFYFTVNNVSNSARGRSDLLPVADASDGYEQFLFDRIEMRGQINSFVWDIQFNGLTEEEIAEKMKNLMPPKRGTTFGHNERVSRQAIAPDLKADDADTDNRIFKNHILGSVGLPPTWFAEGGDVNRATAGEMEPGTLKMFTHDQKIVMAMIRKILRYQVRKKIEKKEIREEIEVVDDGQKKKIKTVDAFTIHTPDLSARDTVKISSSLQQLAAALMIAEGQGWIDSDMAAKIFANVASGLGVECLPLEQDEGEPKENEGMDTAKEGLDYNRRNMTKLRSAFGGRAE